MNMNTPNTVALSSSSPLDQQQQPGNDKISLSIVIHRLVEQSYSNLISLSERLPTVSDLERKKQLVEYLDNTREKFLRLSVLLKWSNHVPTLKKANEIIELLNQEDGYFRDAADQILITKELLANARAPLYDIPTAIDVLTTGSYQRMPTDLKRIIPPPALAPGQIASTIDRLNNEICYKLFQTDIPKEFEPIKVDNGHAHIIVKDEYECFLSLAMDIDKSNWIITSFNPFIYTQKENEGEGPIKLTFDIRMKQVLERIQNRLLTSTQPLFELHCILHYLVISSQLSILQSQMENLKKTRLKNNIRFQSGKDAKDPQSITVYYWIPEEFSMIGSNPQSPIMDPKKNIYIKIIIDEQQRLTVLHNPIIHHPKNDNYFKITTLNLETILFNAIELHSFIRLQRVYNIMLEERMKSTKQQQFNSSACNKALSSFQVNDIKFIGGDYQQLISSTNNETTTTTSTPNNTRSTLPTILYIQLYGSNYLEVSINFQNGRYTLHSSSSKNRDLVAILETKLNNDLNEIKNIVNIFKLKSLLACFEEAALFLGLACFYKIPLQCDLFNDPNYICMRFTKDNDVFYLVISIQNLSFIPTFNLIYCKPNVQTSILTYDSILKVESEELTNMIKECDCGNFQNYVNQLLEKLVFVSRQKINILSVSQHLKQNNINYVINDSSIGFLYLPQQSLIQTNQMTITFPDDDHCSISFHDLNYIPIKFTQQSIELKKEQEEMDQKAQSFIMDNQHITNNNGIWNFVYSTSNDWVTIFQNDLVSVNKIITLTTQLLKLLKSNPIYSNMFTLYSVKPLEIDLICSSTIPIKSYIKVYINKMKTISIDYQPFNNPLIGFLEKKLNNTMDISAFLHSISISNDVIYSVQSLLSPNAMIFFLPLEFIIVPRSLSQIRIIYRNFYSIDIRFVSNEQCIIEDSCHNALKQKLNMIPHLSTIVEQKLGTPAVDSSGNGTRSSWLFNVKTIKQSLQTIIYFIVGAYYTKSIVHYIKVITAKDPRTPGSFSIKFSNDYQMEYHIYLKEHVYFELEFNVPPQFMPGVLEKSDLDLFSQYFKKKSYSPSFRPQTFQSLIQILTIPPYVLKELIKILMSDREKPPLKYLMEIALNSSFQREACVHVKSKQTLLFIIRYYVKTTPPSSTTTSPQSPTSASAAGDSILDIPISYNYKTNQVKYWNRLNSDLNNAEIVPPAIPPFDNWKNQIIQNTFNEIQATSPPNNLDATGTVTTTPILYQFSVSLMKEISSTFSSIAIMNQQQPLPQQQQQQQQQLNTNPAIPTPSTTTIPIKR